MLRCRLFLFFRSNSLEKNGDGNAWCVWGREEGSEGEERLGGGSWAEADEPKGGQKRKRRQQRGAGDTRLNRTEEPTLPEVSSLRYQAQSPSSARCHLSSAPKHQHSTEAEHPTAQRAPREGQPAAARLAQERDATGIWTVLTSHADASAIPADCI